MAFNNNTPDDLSRYSIGEIVDLSGVPTFYDAGSSKWLKSGASTASSNLTTSTKTNLAAAGTASDPTVLAQSSLSLSYNAFGFYASYPIQRISASSVSVVPAYNANTTAVGVGVVTSAGLQRVVTGQTSIVTNEVNSGTNGVVASNNTTIFSYCFTSATALSAYSTTNGTTWTAQTVTGIPVFATTTSTYAHASCSASGNGTNAAMMGWKRTQTASASQFAVFWCGARFLLIGPAATNYMVSLSTDGLAWGGDNTTAVIGATAQDRTLNMQFYRNGNNCYLNIGTSYRYSTDGGVTWAASTFAAAPNPSNYFLQYNQSNPAKLLIIDTSGGTPAFYSADSGATWSADRPLPLVSKAGGLYYKGSVVVQSDRSSTFYVSYDDGVTWTVPTFPIGVLGSSINFFADANRFYAGVNNQAQLLTSSDGVTWTIVTLSQQFFLRTILTNSGCGIIPFDSNTVVLIGYSSSGYNQAIYTTDGGVTWTCSQYTVANTAGNWAIGNSFNTPDGGGVCFCWGNSSLTDPSSPNVLKADITAGGAFYRTGSTAITPIRTGSNAYVRVG